MDDHIALHRRRIGWVVVFLRTVHHPHLRCNAVRTLCCGGKAHVAVFLIHQPSPGDLRPAGVNNYQRQVGAEFLFGMYGADGLWRGFSVLVVSPALHPPGQQHRVAAYSIAGCGIGLTPSADDFLCGVMASVLASAIARGEQNEWLPLTAAMAERAAPRTNLISAAFLRQAAAGQLSSDVLTLIRTLYSSVLSLRLPSAAMNVIAFGETSGTDILTGIYFGQKNYPN